jgi:hypothetical protein
VRDVHVDISLQTATQLKVWWHGWVPYTVSKPAVDKCAKDVRGVLLELVTNRLTNTTGPIAPILKRLATSGHKLYRALFTEVTGEGDAQRIEDHYKNQGHALRFIFRISEDVFVPWGMIYSGDPALLPEEEAEPVCWEAYKDFWCLKFDLTMQYNRIRPDEVGDASGLRMLRIVDANAIGNPIDHLEKTSEKPFLDWLLATHGPWIETVDALERAWEKDAAQIGLLYFYGHANETRLAIGRKEWIEATDLFLTLGKRKRSPGAGCLMLINGCRTAVGDSKGAFLLAASTNGLCGFVGTETDVPDLFALRFSNALLNLMFHGGRDLGDAMHQLYRQHFPLSLVYGVYADRGFRMLQQGAPQNPIEDNFSYGPVGTRHLEFGHVD